MQYQLGVSIEISQYKKVMPTVFLVKCVDSKVTVSTHTLNYQRPIGYFRQEFSWIFREWMEGEAVYDY
jgi:hypothetical protein